MSIITKKTLLVTEPPTKGAGFFEIISLEKRKEMWRSPIIPNLILDAHFQNIVQHHQGITTEPLEITTLEIGDGNTAVTATDTALDNAVVTAIPVGRFIDNGKSLETEFYITDNALPDGTYEEIGLRTGTILATRALFGSAYTKVSGRDTIIKYTISYDAA